MEGVDAEDGVGALLANDVAELIGNEPELTAQLRPGTFVVSGQSRHSYDSAGPRFKKFSGTEAQA